MEPQTPLSMQPSPSDKQRRWPFSKLTTVIGAIIIVLLVIAFIVGLNNPSKKNPTPSLDDLKPGTITGPYIEREGYPRKDIGSGVADALGFTLKKSDDVVKTSKGQVIYPACAVITQSDIRKAGMLTKASQLAGGIEMSYIDGRGSGLIPFDGYSVPAFETSNECRYSLQLDSGSATVDVYQPYLTSDNAIKDDISRNFEAAPAIAGLSGVDIFVSKAANDARKTEANVTTYYARKGTDLTVKLRLDYKDNRQGKATALLKAAFNNLDRLATAPEGAPTGSYEASPTFKQKYLKACSFLDDEGMKVLANAPAAAFVTNRWANSTGVSQFSRQGDQTYYVYAENECERDAVGSGVGVSASGGLANNSPHMRIKATSYTSDKPAAHALASAQQTHKEGISVPGVGDEAIVVRNTVGENELIFRKGRFVLDLTYNTLNQKAGGLDDQNKYAAALLPFAHYMITQMQ